MNTISVDMGLGGEAWRIETVQNKNMTNITPTTSMPVWWEIFKAILSLITLFIGGVAVTWLKDWRTDVKLERAAKLKADQLAIDAKEKLDAEKKQAQVELKNSVNSLHTGFTTLTEGFNNLSKELKTLNTTLATRIEKVEKKVEDNHKQITKDIREIHNHIGFTPRD